MLNTNLCFINGVLSDVIEDFDFSIFRKTLDVNKPEHENMYWYHKDHLASSTQITDRNETVIHHIEYMPSGEQFSEQRDNWATPYKFNGKELDAETGLYYYGARYYTPEIGIWLSVDPLSDKYPHQSNYMYCSGRLVNVIDPDGRDEWEVNSTTGKISRINENKHYVDNNGNRVMVKAGEKYQGELDLSSMTPVDRLTNSNGKSEYFTAGVMDRPTGSSSEYHFSNGDEAAKFYYFVAESSSVEWAFAKLKSNPNRLGGAVGTNHNEGSTIMTGIFELRYGNNIELLSHSHPGLGGPPSMDVDSDKNKGDLNRARDSRFDFKREVYDVRRGRIYSYNRQTYNDIQLGRYKKEDIPWRVR